MASTHSIFSAGSQRNLGHRFAIPGGPLCIRRPRALFAVSGVLMAPAPAAASGSGLGEAPSSPKRVLDVAE